MDQKQRLAIIEKLTNKYFRKLASAGESLNSSELSYIIETTPKLENKFYQYMDEEYPDIKYYNYFRKDLDSKSENKLNIAKRKFFEKNKSEFPSKTTYKCQHCDKFLFDNEDLGNKVCKSCIQDFPWYKNTKDMFEQDDATRAPDQEDNMILDMYDTEGELLDPETRKEELNYQNYIDPYKQYDPEKARRERENRRFILKELENTSLDKEDDFDTIHYRRRK